MDKKSTRATEGEFLAFLAKISFHFLIKKKKKPITSLVHINKKLSLFFILFFHKKKNQNLFILHITSINSFLIVMLD